MKTIIILLGIMLVWSFQTKAQETGSELNNSYSKICENQESVLKPLSFNKDAGPISISVTDGAVNAEVNGKIFFSAPLSKDWKKDNSAPKLTGALLGDKYLLVAQKKPGAKTELYITDVNKSVVSPVNIVGTIQKIVSVDDAGWILIQTKESTNITLVFFNYLGEPVTIAVQ